MRFVLCSRDLDVLRAQRIIGFFYPNYPQITEVGFVPHSNLAEPALPSPRPLWLDRHLITRFPPVNLGRRHWRIKRGHLGGMGWREEADDLHVIFASRTKPQNQPPQPAIRQRNSQRQYRAELYCLHGVVRQSAIKNLEMKEIFAVVK